MIIMLVLKVVFGLIGALFSLIPKIPDFPDEINETLSFFTNTVSQVINFADVLMPVKLAGILITFIITIKNIKWLFRIFMWILRKIPFLGIK